MARRLSILNPHPKKIPGPDLLHCILARHIHSSSLAIEYLTPDGITGCLTFAQLQRRANTLARVLRSTWSNTSCSHSSHLVAPLYIPQCPDLYIAEIAALKAGAAFCPISLDVPEERLRFILRDVDATFLLTTAHLRGTLPELEGVSVIAVDDIPSDSDDGDLRLTISPSQPAYIMYTSGSTGEPKGVIISHSAVTQALLAHDRHLPQFSRFLQFASPTFDVSVFEIFFPLFRGCTLVCVDRRQLLNDLPGCMTRMRVDAAELTPSVVSSLLRGRNSVPTLKLLLTIGEMLRQDVVEQFAESEEEDGILNGMYGPTEATIHCTMQIAFRKDMPIGNIGVPLDTVSAFIVKAQSANTDANDCVDILPMGEEGELAFGGFQLADGYLNRAEQTKAAFVHHPQYGMLYHTGDRARMTGNGQLECLGRISGGQVKLRGQRIELGEIEYAASRTPGCRSAVAEVVAGTLVVFCVHGNSPMLESHIQGTCRAWLPAFMVPGDIILLTDLPYLSSGKVDRKTLQEVYFEKIRTHRPQDGQMSPQTRVIIEIISDVLGTTIDQTTQLTAAGLDSLSSIRISAQLERAGFPPSNAAVLLESRTVHDVESHLHEVRETANRPAFDRNLADVSSGVREAVYNELRTLRPSDDIEDVFVPTAIQSAMLSETTRDNRAYCNWIKFAVSGNRSVEVVRACLKQLSAQHILLRSGFLALAGHEMPYAVVVKKEIASFRVRFVKDFDLDFALVDEVDLLHPCSFQILSHGEETHILLQIHHALYDQWSIDILRKDLSILLDGQRIDRATSFRAVSAYHAAHFQDACSGPSLDFWENHLREVSPTTLPLMNGKRLAGGLERTSWCGLNLDLITIRGKSRSLGCSVPALFQAAIAYLIGSFVGSTDVTYGVVFSGRHVAVPGIESVFGPCLATLPFRVDYSATRTCTDLLRFIQERNQAMQRYAQTPLTDIKRTCQLPPGSPLFDTLFVWQETSFTAASDGLAVKEIDSSDQHEFNLVLEFEPSDHSVHVRATYQQRLIPPQQIEILFQQLEILVKQMASTPNGLVEDLAHCLPHDILSLSNPSPTYCATGHSLLSSIEQHATKIPMSPALIFAVNIDSSETRTHVLTYIDLNVRANRVANFLRSIGLNTNDIVCICMEKCIDMYVAILASMKAGCGYLPLVPEMPVSRINSILNSSAITVCLCDTSSTTAFNTIPNVTVVDITRTNFSQFEASNPIVPGCGSRIAYTVYTSGSTGEPKGVAVTANNLLGNLQSLAELYQVKHGDRLLQACSQAFDVSVFEIFFAFYSGMCLCSGTKDILFRDLEASIRELHVTHLSLTPTVAALVDPKIVPDVRFLVTAGEGVTDLVHRRWAGKALHQGYGPSETTNICTINMGMSLDDSLGNIGRPLRNTSAFVISPEEGFSILPKGAIGEFVFGGEQVFRGYVSMDQLNMKKIIHHPRYGRIYRSGDLGRILHDGSLLISGRVDDQIKLRGNRIELGEINAAMMRYSVVRDCASLVLGKGSVEQRIASFAVPDSSPHDAVAESHTAEMSESEIRRLFELLGDSLPLYMVPSVIVPVTKLPLTSQGKLDKRKLEAILDELNSETKSKLFRDHQGSPDAEPLSDEERGIAASVADTLQIPCEEVTRNGSFFAYGLNSLSAIAFARLISTRLHTNVNVSVILRNPSIARLVQALATQSNSDTSNGQWDRLTLLPSEVVDEARSRLTNFEGHIESILPCTPLQEAMLSASASKARGAYCNSTSLSIYGDLEKLKRSWSAMVARHSILRTRFVTTSAKAHPYVQVILKDTTLPWCQYELLSLESTCSQSTLINSSDAGGVNELNPFRVDAYITERVTTLVLHTHHAIYDGISMSRLLEEVELDYRGKELPPPVQFSSFLTEASKQSGSEATAFWSRHLQGFRPKLFPTCHSNDLLEQISMQRTLPLSSTALDSFCKRYAVSPLSVFQSALVKTLVCCQSADDICFGNVVSGRTLPVEDIGRLVAPCFNTVPVRMDITGIQSNLDLSQRLNKYNADASSYQLTPLRRVQSTSTSPSRALFDSLFILQSPQRQLDETIWVTQQDVGTMDMPLVLEIIPEGDRFTLLFHYLRPRLSDGLTSHLARAFISALDSCLKFPHSDVGHFHGFDRTDIAGMLASEDLDIGEAHKNIDQSQVMWSSKEETIRHAFAHLAGVDHYRVTKDTTIYQIGLDSLNAVQLASQLRTLGFCVDAANVMEAPTPRSLAALLHDYGPSGAAKDESIDLDLFDRRNRDEVLKDLHVSDDMLQAVRPCIPAQIGMLAQSLQSQGRLYVNHVAYDVPVSISMVALWKAWTAVQQRHQVLRMGFCRLADPKMPFAMAIMTAHSAQIPFIEVGSKVELDAAESQATKAIMKSIRKCAWRVTMRSSKDRNIMLLSLHHALYDADSLRIILCDFTRALSSLRLDSPPGIDPLLRSTLAAAIDGDGSTAEFWSNTLKDVTISKFPDLAPKKVNHGGLQRESLTCNLSLVSVKAYCQEEGATIQALGQTAWALLLAAYTGDTDVTFGTVLSGRATSSAWKIAFPSVTTIPVRCSTTRSWSEVLQSMVKYNASAQRHRYAALTDIQRLAEREQQLLFDTVFVYQKSPSQSDGLEWPIVRQTAAVDYVASLELEIARSEDIVLHLTFNNARIPLQHARLILDQYEFILTRILSDDTSPDLPSPLFSVIPAKELYLPTTAKLLHHFVEDNARLWPDREALEFVFELRNGKNLAKTWTYKELDERGNQVAHLIQLSEVPSSRIVAVCMEKCPEAAFAFVGILKAGCSFLAIDPDLPERRLQLILEDSGASLLLVHEKQLSNNMMKTVRSISLNEGMLVSLPSSPVKMRSASASATCYCLYTSGTTGTPKGCEITHENAVQAMIAFQRLFAGHWTEYSRWLQFASYWFDVSVLEQFWSWSVGICVVGAPRDVVLEDLASFIQNLNITHIDLTPSLARLLQPGDVPNLWDGVFITGGEALKQEIIDVWGPKTTICNGYGPTEATIGVTMNTFIAEDAKPSNIGCQFDNVGTYVLRPGSDEPVLRGAVGELCVSGKLVGKGYLNRPDLSKRCFPFLERFNEKLYRTGDLVRLLVDGSFAFIGRQDSQTKLRGQRLEMSEIDSVIRTCGEKVTEVVSLVLKAADGGKEMLVSFLSASTKRRVDEIEIDHAEEARLLSKAAYEACTSRLPGYMVPTHIIPITSLPLTVNNKADTKRLAALFDSTSLKELQYLQDVGAKDRPLNPTERRICTILSKILSISLDHATANSNLFSLGLSSISSISFASLLRRDGFRGVSVAVIMNNPLLGQLTAALSGDLRSWHQEQRSIQQAKLWMTAFSRRHCSTVVNRLSAKIDDVETIAPCAPLQQGLILESLKHSSRPYFNLFQYSLGDVNTQVLMVALQELVSCTQFLRTQFVNTDDGFAQVVLRTRQPPLAEWFLEDKDVDRFVHNTRTQWLARNEEELTSPFELHVVRSPGRGFLIVYIHHALYDGVSYERMMNRISEMYFSKARAGPSPTFIDALPYGPLRQLHDAKEFWIQRLNGRMYVPLPEKEGVVPQQDPTVTCHIGSLSIVEALRKELGVSNQAVIQACFEIAVGTHAPLIQTYGMVVSGRSIELEGADQVLGPMFNTLPQVLAIRPDWTISEHISRCHSSNVEALPYQHTPLRDIRKWCGRYPTDPMFDVLFVFQYEQIVNGAKIADLMLPIEQAPRAEYSLACEITMSENDNIAITLLAQRQFFDKHIVQALLDSFKEILSSISNASELAIGDLVDFAAREKAQDSMPNDLGVPQVNGVHHFEWTSNASNIRRLIAQLTGVHVEDIDDRTSIFALGLDSIDAVRLVSRLRSAGISISVSQILQAQTIPRMLQMMQDNNLPSKKSVSNSKLMAIEKQLGELDLADVGDVERVLPATPHQEALIADMLRLDLREYFNHDVLRLEPHVELDRLVAAWQTVIDASPILRTSFREITDPGITATYAQIVHRTNHVQYSEHRLEGIDELEAVLDSIRQDVLANTDTTPPLRLTLATVGSQSYVVLSLAHALYDGHSLALLHQDVQRAFETTFKARPSNDNAVEAALDACSGDTERFWAGTLAGATIQKFPSAHKDPGELTAHRGEKQSRLHPDLARSFCQDRGVSMPALAQTCWALTLAHYSKSLEVTFGLVLACRDSVEAEQVMFPTMNTVVMRSSLHGSRTEMLQYMQSMITDMLPYQRTPLRAIQAAAGKSVYSDGSGIARGFFDSLFIYQHRPSPSDDTTLPLYESVGGSSSVEYPVAVEMEVVGERIFIRAACKGHIVDQRGTKGILDKMENILQAIVNSPNEPTVDFEEDGVSVCGMEPFYLEAPGQRFEDEASEQVEANDTATVQPSRTTSIIIEVLALVSKAPMADFDPKSSIESIGIDSISAIKVSALLRKQSIRLSVSEIVRAKTPIRMAELVENRSDLRSVQIPSRRIITTLVQKHGFNSIVARAGIDAMNVEVVLPATAGQVYMISMWQKTGGQIFYPTFSYQLDTDLKLSDIRAAWNALVRRHVVLRTVFCSTESCDMRLLQAVLREIPNGSLSDHEAPSPASRQPLVSLSVEENDNGYLLKLSIHHALYDAVSLPLLVQDFQHLLESSSLPQPQLKFEDFLALSATEQAKQAQKEFWTKYLHDVKPLQLLQPEASGPQRKVEIFRPGLLVAAGELGRIARKESLSMQAFLFAAHAKTYSVLTGNAQTNNDETDDVVIGIYLSNRSHLPALDSLPVPTLNMVPLLVRSPRQRSLIDVAKQIHADLQDIGTPENSAVGLWEIADWTGIKIDTFVNFLKLPETSGEGDDPEREGGVRLMAVDDRRLEERHRVVEAERLNFKVPAELQGLQGVEAHQHSVDVEMTVRDGKLDVGLFCPEAMLALGAAESALEELVATLEKFVGKSRG